VNDLIDRLTQDLSPVDRHAAVRRMLLWLGGGVVLSALMMLVILGPRPDIAQAAGSFSFWMKLAFMTAIAALAWVVARRLSAPGRDAGFWPWLIGAVLALLFLGGAFQLIMTPAGERLSLWLGYSWSTCPTWVLLLSLPVMAALMWAIRAMAPTRLRLAGLAAGIAAGGFGAAIYSFYCVEESVAFLATWYMLGVALSGLIGWLIGPYALRWR
jgi:hypothetical protein